jgi:hypothetical protein
MKLLWLSFYVTISFSFSLNVIAQTFVNLDFESAQLSGLVPQTYVPFENALPGWHGYVIASGGEMQVLTQAFYTAQSPFIADSPQISIQTTNAPFLSSGLVPIQGLCSVFLDGIFFPHSSLGPEAAIGQIGKIPNDAQSLIFLGVFAGKVFFAGQPLSYSVLETSTNYYTFAADISQFAGQTGELLFETTHTPPPGVWATLDNIQFSPLAVPEPSVLTLLNFSLLVFYGRMKLPKTG